MLFLYNKQEDGLSILENLKNEAQKIHGGSSYPLLDLLLRLKVVADYLPYWNLTTTDMGENVVLTSESKAAVSTILAIHQAQTDVRETNEVLKSMLLPTSSLISSFANDYTDKNTEKSPKHYIYRNLLDVYLRNANNHMASGITAPIFQLSKNEYGVSVFNHLIKNAITFTQEMAKGITTYRDFLGEDYEPPHNKGRIRKATLKNQQAVCWSLLVRISHIVHEKITQNTKDTKLLGIAEHLKENAIFSAHFLWNWLLLVQDATQTPQTLYHYINNVEIMRERNRSLIPALQSCMYIAQWITSEIKAVTQVVSTLVQKNEEYQTKAVEDGRLLAYALPEDIYPVLSAKDHIMITERGEPTRMLSHTDCMDDYQHFLSAVKQYYDSVMMYMEAEKRSFEQNRKAPIVNVIKGCREVLYHNPSLDAKHSFRHHRNALKNKAQPTT